MSAGANRGPDGSAARVRFSSDLRWSIAVSALGAIMSLLDATIINVALHSLSVHFEVSVVTVQWVVTSYLLALAAMIPMTGWAARRVGVKRLYLISLAVFTVASLLCGLAGTVEQLIVFRIAQGAAGGVIASVGQMLVVMRADQRNMARAMSAVGVPMITAPVVGPTIGGLLLESAGWRWIFFVNLPVGIIAVLLVVRFLPTDKIEKAQPLDVLGLIVVALGMTGITYGLAEIRAVGGAAYSSTLISLLGGVVLVTIFVVRALLVKFPLLDVRLYRSAAFLSASLTTFCSGAAVFGGMIVLPLYLQSVRYEDAVSTGLLLIPQGLGTAIGMYLSGRSTDRFGAGACALIGGTLMVVTTVPLGFVTERTSYLVIDAVTFGRGIGIGLITMPAMTAAFRAISPTKVNDAAPQLNVLQRLGGAIGTAIFAVVLQWGIDQGTGTIESQAAAFAVTFWWVVGVTVAATIPTIALMMNERRRSAQARAPNAVQGTASS